MRCVAHHGWTTILAKEWINALKNMPYSHTHVEYIGGWEIEIGRVDALAMCLNVPIRDLRGLLNNSPMDHTFTCCWQPRRLEMFGGPNGAFLARMFFADHEHSNKFTHWD